MCGKGAVPGCVEFGHRLPRDTGQQKAPKDHCNKQFYYFPTNCLHLEPSVNEISRIKSISVRSEDQDRSDSTEDQGPANEQMLLSNPVSDADPLLDRAHCKEEHAGESEDVEFPPVQAKIKEAVIKKDPGVKDSKHGAAHMKSLPEGISAENNPCKHNQYKSAQTFPELPHQRVPEDSRSVEKPLPECSRQ